QDATPYGIASYVLSSDNPYLQAGRIQSGPFSFQVPGDESRGFVCINGGVNTPKYWGCTAHMNNTNPGSSVTGAPAEKQFENYYQTVLQILRVSGGQKTIYWGGDLYVFPNEIPNLNIPGGDPFFSANL